MICIPFLSFSYSSVKTFRITCGVSIASSPTKLIRSQKGYISFWRTVDVFYTSCKHNANRKHYYQGHCCKVSDEAAFCLIQRPYISKTLLTRRISPRGSP
ncbi:hypothetical protein C5P32_25530 [Escherichia coli]|nr:hypothetical protein C5P30_25555 [Escherichia coli]PPY75136.1 hypothetical protein C5P32_25530 [Escherichia coli]